MADPSDMPVTIPVLLTVAIKVLEEDHVPPANDASNEILEDSHTKSGPETVRLGAALTETEAVASDEHNVVELIKVNVAEPVLTPVTIPPLVTVATKGLELVQVPPDDGDNVVVEPIQILEGPMMLTTGFALMVTGVVAFEGQLVIELVNTKVAVP